MRTATLGALCAAALTLAASASLHAASISGQGTWESTLQGRDLDGDLSTFEAYYDTALDITWLANASGAGSGTWDTATAWASTLNINGITDWSLPATSPSVGSGTPTCSNTGPDCGYNVDPASSALAHMFYVTLGNTAFCNTSGSCGQTDHSGLTNTGPFSNLQSSSYWSATEYAPNTSNAWTFLTATGLQGIGPKTGAYYAWAVHAGDVGTPIVTVPTTVNTGYRKPTVNRPDGGGDWNGYEISPAYAYVADGISAEDIDSGSDLGTSCISSCKDKHRFYNFGINIPAASSITGLEVRLKAKADSASGSPRIYVQVSWDGGVSWTARKRTKVLGTVLTNYKLGTSTDTWGRAWSANDFTDANFRVRLIDESSDITRDFSLDSVAVRVTYY